jgi:hypothetical protein
MFKHHHIVCIGLLVLAPCLASNACADPILRIDFQNDTVGSPPSTNLTPGNLITQPYAIGGYAPMNVSAGSTIVGSAPGIAQGAIMTSNAANPELGAQWIDTAFQITGQQISMSFDVNILAAPTNATSQPKFLGSGTAGILLGMNAYTTGGWAYRFAAAPTSANGGVFAFRTPDNTELVPFFNYVEGQAYHVAIVADYDTGTLDAFVDGNKLLSGFAFWTSGQSNVTTQEFFFHLNGELGISNSVALDNIFSPQAQVPEPCSLILWSVLGAVTCGVARRRRS